MQKKSAKYMRSVVVLTVLCSCLLASTASAREVEVLWNPDSEQGITSREGARIIGFRRAVFEEALSLLPGVLPEHRQEVLADYLRDKAHGYVLSYHEEDNSGQLGSSALPVESAEDVPPMPQAEPEEKLEAQPDRLLVMDVTVNRAGLKQDLQRLGVFYTLSETVSYNLTLEGEAQASWDEIGRLQTLSGLVARADASSQITIKAQERELTKKEKRAGVKRALLWTGSLSAEEDAWSAVGDSLEEVWFRLWSGYFTRPGVGAGLMDSFSLIVSGWFAPDGVKAFDAELSGWDDVVENAALVDIAMRSAGIEAVWSVTALDRSALDSRLAEVLPGRGLEWKFVAPGTAN